MEFSKVNIKKKGMKKKGGYIIKREVLCLLSEAVIILYSLHGGCLYCISYTE